MKVLLLCLSAPLIISFWPPLGFWRHRRPLYFAIALIILIFGGWDILAVARGHWWFNPDGVWGFRILGLPLEEYLFFVVIPFASIFTWEAFKFIACNISKKS